MLASMLNINNLLMNEYKVFINKGANNFNFLGSY